MVVVPRVTTCSQVMHVPSRTVALLSQNSFWNTHRHQRNPDPPTGFHWMCVFQNGRTACLLRAAPFSQLVSLQLLFPSRKDCFWRFLCCYLGKVQGFRHNRTSLLSKVSRGMIKPYSGLFLYTVVIKNLNIMQTTNSYAVYQEFIAAEVLKLYGLAKDNSQKTDWQKMLKFGRKKRDRVDHILVGPEVNSLNNYNEILELFLSLCYSS